MVSQGRALAVAAVWIVLPLGAAALVLGLWAADRDGDWDSFAIGLAAGGLIYLAPLSLLAAAVWIARRAGAARSAAALGAQGGLVGWVVAAAATVAYLATHWN